MCPPFLRANTARPGEGLKKLQFPGRDGVRVVGLRSALSSEPQLSSLEHFLETWNHQETVYPTVSGAVQLGAV